MSSQQNALPARRRPRQPAQPAPGPYMCRVGGGAFALTVLRDLGYDSRVVLAAAGLDPAVFGEMESIVPLQDFYRMAEACLSASGRPDFGLLVAARAGTNGGGLLWQLAQSAADVKGALESLTRFVHLNLRWGSIELSAAHGMGSLVFSLVLPGSAAAWMIEDAVIGIVFAFMRELCGPAWRPRQVLLAHRQNADPAAYTAYFGAPVQYDCVSSALIFPASDLKRPVFNPIALEKPELAARVDASVHSRRLSFAEEIRRMIRRDMDKPDLSADSVAKLHGIDRRTLSRRLSAEGTSFSELHTSLRYESARTLLRHSEASLSAITAALGYSEQSAFNRAFQAWSGMSPKRYRAL